MNRMYVSVGRRLRAAVMLVVVIAIGLAGSMLAQASDIGDIDVLALVPATPGSPEGVVAHGSSVFVSGPARFGTAGTGPSAIQVFDRRTGTLKQTILVTGENLAFEHALSNMAWGGAGR
ncbi:MAG: hypothetical protein WAW26_20305, partial [Anaerolineae bacterium]